MSPAPTPSATLTPEYAFVVQFRTGTQIESGQMRGRVEHVVSRHATTFQSLQELLAFMALVLHERETSRSTEL
jgi:hypothetical protein